MNKGKEIGRERERDIEGEKGKEIKRDETGVR